MGHELQDKVTSLEKENVGLQKEVAKLREVIETKEVTLDRNAEEKEKYEREIQKLNVDTTNLVVQIEKLQEFERKSTELISKASVYAETIADLQKDLISEKVQRIYSWGVST